VSPKPLVLASVNFKDGFQTACYSWAKHKLLPSPGGFLWIDAPPKRGLTYLIIRFCRCFAAKQTLYEWIIIPQRSTDTSGPTAASPAPRRPLNDCYSSRSRSRIRVSVNQQTRRAVRTQQRRSIGLVDRSVNTVWRSATETQTSQKHGAKPPRKITAVRSYF